MNHLSLAMRAVLLTVTLSPLYAWAAGTATITIGGDSNTMSWLNSNTIRFDMPSTDGSYMISRDGKAYMVSTEAAGGMPPVMEIGGMMQGFSEAVNSDEGGKTSPLAMRITAINAIGKKETVAGIDGEVYELTTTDQQGKSQTMQAVLTDDPLAIEMTDAYLALSETMVGAERVAEFKNALSEGKRGLLRMGDDMVVQSIAANPPTADSFELPSKPVNMGDMMRKMMKQSQ
ncbi:hypothetical protein [Pollutimonas harenae]|uniref:DUF4412 domain-containing protein n=1 Tax=Pollutimonas harenae TaxID=657015 RepID=A0A853H164_9BURK|nr:hypothetical protein [Pollutimonas harenae]NYT84985.1 hypothetical protein [Pollutimonas harenae]TEA72625.1 hypothetical protein ERD84_01575 [Pollutimonas harenae]